MSCELYSEEWCRRRKFPTANVVLLLRDRELGSRKQGSHFIKGSREFYYSFPIQKHIRFTNRPLFFPIRFTPDGSKLIGIGHQLQDVVIFDYHGVQCTKSVAADMLFRAVFPTCKLVSFWNSSQAERQAFGSLSRDCCLITADSRHLVVCASTVVPESCSRISGGVQKNNESLPPGHNTLEDVKFYSIDVAKGKLLDVIKFEFDVIHIGQGVYLLDRTLAILSIQHQTIHMYQLDRLTGAFIPVQQIGRSVLDDDRLYVGVGENPIVERFFTGFRQRFLTFAYRQHMARGEQQVFLRNVGFYRSLKMHKIQMVGADLLLIRMDNRVVQPESGASATSAAVAAAASAMNYVFVLYEWRHARVCGVYGRASKELFQLLERFNESFRSAQPNNHFPTSMEHCGYVRSHYEHLKSTLILTSPTETYRRFLNFLPYSCATVPTSSPYLDPQMFSLDEKSLSNIERGKVPVDQPLRTFSRRTNQLHVDLEFQSFGLPKQHLYVRLIFHPTDPFAMSVNRVQPAESLITWTTFHVPKGLFPTK